MSLPKPVAFVLACLRWAWIKMISGIRVLLALCGIKFNDEG